jgi:hypothetical protein
MGRTLDPWFTTGPMEAIAMTQPRSSTTGVMRVVGGRVVTALGAGRYAKRSAGLATRMVSVMGAGTPRALTSPS